MEYAFKLPDIGEGIAEGEIVKWLVSPGQEVAEDDIIAEVQTDKAVVEIPSPVNGVVLELKYKEGEVVPVGEVFIIFRVADSEQPDPAPQTANEPEQENVQFQIAEQALENQEPVKAATVHRTPVLATPAVRKKARQMGIDITKVQGTGRHGQVTAQDLENYLAAQKAAAPRGPDKDAPAAEEPEVPAPKAAASTPSAIEERVPLRGIRRTIAQNMVKSKYTAPHVTMMDEAEVSRLVELRQRLKEKARERGIKLTYLPFVVKALVAAAKQFPALNATLDDEAQEIVYKYSYHVGIATATERGLMVPVIHDADRKSLWQIAAELQELSDLARAGRLTLSHLQGGTISISNIGNIGGTFFTPVINHPEVAILGVGRIMEKPIVTSNRTLAVGTVLPLSLSFDHRVLDGEEVQQAINLLKKLLSNPDELLMEV